MLRLGLDVDGVVADFRAAFHALAATELGRRDVETELSKGDIERLWKAVARASNWWLDLAAYEPDQVARLYELARDQRWEVFFMTSRPPSAGDSVQLQTQVWLEKCGFYLPSVMTAPAGARGELARVLRLDLVVDDHLVNCMEIVGASNARVLHMARGEVDPARREQAESRGIGVVSTLSQALDATARLHDVLSSRQGRLLRLGDWFAPRKDQMPLPRDPRQNRR
ncbi:MAG TPA: hypothetical protein VE379_07830 [Vicinamibacterales bacterium]|jgi:hypothetical protein|nr:hypothetical protein [Vicinamibacterales bacterium]